MTEFFAELSLIICRRALVYQSTVNLVERLKVRLLIGRCTSSEGYLLVGVEASSSPHLEMCVNVHLEISLCRNWFFDLQSTLFASHRRHSCTPSKFGHYHYALCVVSGYRCLVSTLSRFTVYMDHMKKKSGLDARKYGNFDAYYYKESKVDLGQRGYYLKKLIVCLATAKSRS